MSILNFFLNLSDMNIHATIKKITWKIMLDSIPHQKFCVYHLPTGGRAGIKLGDAWYVSNVYINFFVSCYYIIRFWCLMGFIMHFYIIFGTNLLTKGPVQLVVFWPISVFRREGISNGRKPSRGPFLEQTQPRRLVIQVWKSAKLPWGKGRAQGVGTPPPSWAPQSSTAVLLSPIYTHVP